MFTNITEKQAVELLLKYNKDNFHLQHAATVQSVMKWYAVKLGWELDKLLNMTLSAMRDKENEIAENYSKLKGDTE